MKQVSFRIVGTSDLLVNNPELSMLPKNDSRGKTVIPAKEEDAAQRLYINAHSEYCFPTIGIRSGIIKAATAFKDKNNKRATLQGKVSHIRMVEPLMPIRTAADWEPFTTYEIDSRRVVINKAGILRHRPKFVNWGGDFSILYDETLIDPQDITDILKDAGIRLGIGDYRPERKGWFGCFEVIN